jgi:hypothetical protein
VPERAELAERGLRSCRHAIIRLAPVRPYLLYLVVHRRWQKFGIGMRGELGVLGR